MAFPSIDPRRLPRLAQGLFVIAGLLPWIIPEARAHLPLGSFGEGLDQAFVTMCHRMPERTLVLSGVAMPVCSRCAGIYAGVALGAIVAWPRLSTSGWRFFITAAGLSMLLDVVTQDLGLHPVWHVTRLASGLLFGFAMAAGCIVTLRREAAAADELALARGAT